MKAYCKCMEADCKNVHYSDTIKSVFTDFKEGDRVIYKPTGKLFIVGSILCSYFGERTLVSCTDSIVAKVSECKFFSRQDK